MLGVLPPSRRLQRPLSTQSGRSPSGECVFRSLASTGPLRKLAETDMQGVGVRQRPPLAAPLEQQRWRFAAMAVDRSRALSPASLADELSRFDGMDTFCITPVRN
jgi:hypothetical protein